MRWIALDWCAQKSLEVILNEQSVLSLRNKYLWSQNVWFLNWPQYIAEGKKSRPVLCTVEHRPEVWLFLIVFPTGAVDCIVSVLRPSSWPLFSLNWTIDHYGLEIWLIQVYISVWCIMVIDRFFESKYSTFLFFLLKD